MQRRLSQLAKIKKERNESRKQKVYEGHALPRELTTRPDLRRLIRTAEQVAQLLAWPVIDILFHVTM